MEDYPQDAVGLPPGVPAVAAVPKAIATPKYKKAPDAPKRFKSAFIIFSAEKHREIKADLAKEGRSEKTTEIAKLVSEAWRHMTAEDKEIWEERARKDKARYEVEKSMYKGPWKIPANKRTPKDPTAPKRPMSAFLAFSNKRRAGLKREHTDATNSDLSKMLSKTWKEAPEELRSKYMQEEAALRAAYKVEMAKWRTRVAAEKKVERQERESIAMQTAEARQNDVINGVAPGSNPTTMGLANQYAIATGQPPNAGQPGQDMMGQQMYGNPYANMATSQQLGLGGFAGMPNDPSQYPNLMNGGGTAAGGGLPGQSGFMGAANAQQQIMSQIFGPQYKQSGGYQGYPNQGMGQYPGQPQPPSGQPQQAPQQMVFTGNYGPDVQRAMMAAQGQTNPAVPTVVGSNELQDEGQQLNNQTNEQQQQGGEHQLTGDNGSEEV